MFSISWVSACGNKIMSSREVWLAALHDFSGILLFIILYYFFKRQESLHKVSDADCSSPANNFSFLDNFCIDAGILSSLTYSWRTSDHFAAATTRQSTGTVTSVMQSNMYIACVFATYLLYCNIFSLVYCRLILAKHFFPAANATNLVYLNFFIVFFLLISILFNSRLRRLLFVGFICFLIRVCTTH